MVFSIEELREMLLALNREVVDTAEQRKQRAEGAVEMIGLIAQKLIDKQKEYETISESNIDKGPGGDSFTD